MKKLLKTKFTPYLLIFIAQLIYFTPYFINPKYILGRTNDLTEFFWPLFYFTKEQIVTKGTIPLWNNMILSGTPLLPDPQSPISYLPNFIFLFFSVDISILISFFLHGLLAGIGMYLLSINELKFSKITSYFCAFAYMFAPRLAGYIEAGHFGLVSSYAWIPFSLLLIISIAHSPRVIKVLLLSFTFLFLFNSHLLTFLILLPFFISIFFMTLLQNRDRIIYKLFFLLLSFVFFFGLTAFNFLPQLEWKNETTRYLLLTDREVFPIWQDKREFISDLTLWPLFDVAKINTEKWIFTGNGLLILAFVGLLRLKKLVYKIIIVLTGLAILTISLNNTSPLYTLLISHDYYVILRVATRIWIIALLLLIMLSGYGLDLLIKMKRSTVVSLFVTIILIESLAGSYLRIFSPFKEKTDKLPDNAYEILEKDDTKYRVFCTTRCIPQKDAAIRHLELMEGYNTIQQTNYYKHMWQLTNSYWNYYTLSLPPFGTYISSKIQPTALYLGDYNIKYIYSPHQLTDPNFKLLNKYGDYNLYENTLLKPRAYYLKGQEKVNVEAKVIYYSPNEIRVEIDNPPTNQLILSEVYSKGWDAYLNGVEKIKVQQEGTAMRMVDMNSDTKFVVFKYQPLSFQIGLAITTTTYIIMGFIIFKKRLRRLFFD